MVERGLGLTGSALSIVGLAVSSYLTVAHYNSAKVLACPEHGLVNCTKVTTSSYSSQLGVPLAVLGVGYFVVMLAVQLPGAWRSSAPAIRMGRVLLATVGAAAALWLIYVELFRLDAICLYCTVVHALAVLLFGVTVIGGALRDGEGLRP